MWPQLHARLRPFTVAGRKDDDDDHKAALPRKLGGPAGRRSRRLAPWSVCAVGLLIVAVLLVAARWAGVGHRAQHRSSDGRPIALAFGPAQGAIGDASHVTSRARHLYLPPDGVGAAVEQHAWTDRFFVVVHTNDWTRPGAAALFLNALHIAHPAAFPVIVDLAPQPRADIAAAVERFRAMGYAGRIVHLPSEALIASGWWLQQDTRPWVAAMAAAAAVASSSSSYPHAQEHVADLVRMYLLYSFGGTALAPDVVLLRPLVHPLPHEGVVPPPGVAAGATVGEFLARDRHEAKQAWFHPGGADNEFASTAAMRLRQGSALAHAVLNSAAFTLSPSFDASDKQCTGAVALNLALTSVTFQVKMAADGDANDEAAAAALPQLLPLTSFSPAGFDEGGALRDAGGIAAPLLYVQHVRRSSVGITLRDRTAEEAHVVHAGSVVDHLMRAFALVPLVRDAPVQAPLPRTAPLDDEAGPGTHSDRAGWRSDFAPSYRHGDAGSAIVPLVPEHDARHGTSATGDADPKAYTRDDRGGPGDMDAHCRLTLPPVSVVRGRTLTFAGEYAAYVSQCAPLLVEETRAGRRTQPEVEIVVTAAGGSIAPDGAAAKAGDIGAAAAAGGSGASSWRARVKTVRELNARLAGLVYTPPPEATADVDDTLIITIATVPATRAAKDSAPSGDGMRVPARVHLMAASHVLVFNRLVTVMTHTAGRPATVGQLYASVQRGYPGTRVLGSDDTPMEQAAPRASKQHAAGWQQAQAAVQDQRQPVFGPHMTWVPVPVDCGLSYARNRLVEAAQTPYVQLLDDDFTVEEGSHLDLLLIQLHLSKYDIASPVVPYDIKTFTNFRGFLDTSRGNLELKPGMYGRNGYGCAVVDFVPNVFMGKRASLAAIKWDEDLKLGEHENFFLRAKQAGLRIASCDHVAVYHHQQPWWDEGAAKDEREKEYNKRRQRVFAYMKQSIVKHGLKKLISFGVTQVTAD